MHYLLQNEARLCKKKKEKNETNRIKIETTNQQRV